jgi:hypothetical protein
MKYPSSSLEVEALVRYLHERDEEHRRERVRHRINQVWDIVARERGAMTEVRT